MKSKSWLRFLMGVLTGILLSCCGMLIVEVGRGFASWGALVYATDTEVQARVKASGIVLPSGAQDIHHAYTGFVDSSLWIKFTVPKNQIWEVVRASIAKSEADFSPRHPENLLEQVYQGRNQKHDLSWWQPSSVKAPKSWSKIKISDGEAFHEDWLIDMETGTFYISRWDT